MDQQSRLAHVHPSNTFSAGDALQPCSLTWPLSASSWDILARSDRPRAFNDRPSHHQTIRAAAGMDGLLVVALARVVAVPGHSRRPGVGFGALARVVGLVVR